MELSAPALVSTMTWWPASTSAFTPLGTMPTRDSWSFTSLGTPMIMSSAFAGDLFAGIDLRALQAVRVIHVHGLPLRIEIDGADATFAVSVPCSLYPPDRQVDLRADGRRVHVRDAGIQVAHRAIRLVHIA